MADTATGYDLVDDFLPLVKEYIAASNTRTYGDESFRELAQEAIDGILDQAHELKDGAVSIDEFWMMVVAYREGYRNMRDRVEKAIR